MSHRFGGEVKKTMKRPKETRSSLLKKVACKSTVDLEDTRSRFYLLEKPSQGRKVAWDPWPVKKSRENALFKEAKRLIDLRNTSSFDNSIDKIILLPASGSVAGVPGGTGNMDLYSVRSPSILPRRIHLWKTAGGKVMVRTRVESKSLVGFLEGLDAKKSWGSVKHLHFWKSLSVNKNNSKQLILPERMKDENDVSEHFQDQMYRRWRAVVIFPIMELPAELREMIFSFAMMRIAEPYEMICNKPDKHTPLPKPNMSLTLVNKQMHGEAMAILFSQATFSFRHYVQIMRFLNVISEASFFALRSIELKLDHESLLKAAGIDIRRSKTHLFDPQNSMLGYSSTLQLQHLRICFPHPREHYDSWELDRACQRIYCNWAFMALHRIIKNIPHLELEGCIKDDQKAIWLEVLAESKELDLAPELEDMQLLRALIR